MSLLETLERPDGERLAFRRVAGEGSTVIWLGGFHSNMEGRQSPSPAHLG